MNELKKILPFVKPYWKRATIALILLSSLVIMDLSIPLLIERIINQGIEKHNQTVVIQTSLFMIGLSILSTVIAVANSILSVQVGESVARDLRDALFLKIQTFSFGNLDRQNTGQLMVRLTSDVAALKTLIQMSLRIGTRAPLLMVGSLILMVSTSPSLALTMLPLLAGHFGHPYILHYKDGAALPDRAAKTGPVEHCSAGKRFRSAPGQGLCAGRF